MERTARRFRIAAGLVCAFGLIAIGLLFWQLWSSQRAERLLVIEQADRRASQIARAAADRLGVLVRSVDFALLEARREYAEYGADGAQFHEMVEFLRKSFPEGSLQQLSIAGREGALAYSSLGPAGRVNVNIRDREHFKAHLGGEDRLFISKPVLGRVSGKWSVQFTRPLLRAGRFDGVAVISVSPEYLGTVLAAFDREEQDTLGLHDSEGTFIARGRSPFDQLTGSTLKGQRDFMRPDAPLRGRYRDKSHVDGRDRIFAWERVPGTPLIVVAGADVGTALAPFERHFRQGWQNAGGLAGAVLVLGFAMLALLARLSRKQQAVAASEERFRQLITLSSDWYWEQDEQFRFTFMSGDLQARTGIDVGTHLGQTRWDIHALNLTGQDWARHRAQLERHEPFRDFVMCRGDRDGHEHWFSVSGDPVFGEDGRFAGYRGVGHDITGRLAIERRQRAVDERLHSALENLSELIAITDAEDRIVYVNRGFREFNASVAAHLEPGRPYEEHLRAGVALGNYPDAIGREEEWIAARMGLRRNPSGPVERARQGGRWLLVTDQRLPDGGVVTVGLDITERKRAERTTRLEHEVTRLLADAATAREGFEAAMRALCAAEGWDLAEYWAVDRAAAALRRSAHWVSPQWPAARDFIDRSAGVRFRHGEGLPGSVWQTAEPLWIPELQREPRMRRADLANETGMGGALLVPVMASGQVTGVLMFVSREIRAPDAMLPLVLASIGSQIGQLVRRKQAEERLRENEQRLSALVNSALEAIVIADDRQRILAFNPAAEAIFGCRAQEVIGAPLAQLIPERFRDAHRGHMARYAGTGASSRRMGEAGRVSGLRADGSEFLAEAAISQFAVGEERFFTVMLRDVTEQVRIDRELRDLNANLEQRVAERTSEVQAALHELESFSYTVSHDLRAPARAMAGFARIVHDDFGPQLPEEARRLLLRIAKAGTDMGAMVDGLLELTRISRRELVRRPVNLGALAAEVWRDLAADEPGRTVEFHMMDAGLRTEGDPVLLRNLLLNLLGNARKYTRGRSGAAVWFGRAPEGEYFVRDNGVGFDMAHAGKLFGEFQRLHSEREFEGHGIGLALARRIVLRHGGLIRAEGAPGKGATFLFTLR